MSYDIRATRDKRNDKRKSPVLPPRPKVKSLNNYGNVPLRPGVIGGDRPASRKPWGWHRS